MRDKGRARAKIAEPEPEPVHEPEPVRESGQEPEQDLVDAPAAEASEPAASPSSSPSPGRSGRGGETGFYFYGVGRTRGWRGRGEVEEVLRVRYRDLEALVRPVPFRLPGLDVARVQSHQRTVEALMRRGTIVPAPYGVVFRDRRALVRFLEDQYLALDEGLAFLEGHWEMRVHAVPQGTEEVSPELEELAVQIYAELRRAARAAIPFPRDENRLLSAAFLVERGSWIEFVNRADDLVAHSGLSFDITGPWAPYDFVRMSA
jgi:hypothetical protein